MSCEICGRNSCTASFHSVESQQAFDEVADNVKDRMKSSLYYKIDRIDCEVIDGKQLVNLEDVFKIIDEY